MPTNDHAAAGADPAGKALPGVDARDRSAFRRVETGDLSRCAGRVHDVAARAPGRTRSCRSDPTLPCQTIRGVAVGLMATSWRRLRRLAAGTAVVAVGYGLAAAVVVSATAQRVKMSAGHISSDAR